MVLTLIALHPVGAQAASGTPTDAPPANTGQIGETKGNVVLPVPAAYVLDAGGKVTAVFGAPGTRGRPGRCDSPDVPRGAVVGVVDPNPLQAALDFASEHHAREVRLDIGEYTFATPQKSHSGTIGFYVPSHIHLKGVMIGDAPGTVLMPAYSLVGDGVAPQRRFELLMLTSGSLTDRSIPLIDTTIEAVMLDARLGGGWCLLAGGGTGLKLLRVHAMGPLATAMVIGCWDITREDPDRPGGATIYYQHDFEIAECHIHSVHGDGICTIGWDGYVHDNIIENCTSNNNALTPFIGSRRIRFIHNTIINYGVAFGLDGSSMPMMGRSSTDAPAPETPAEFEPDPDKEDTTAPPPPYKAPITADQANRAKLYKDSRGWDGYNRDHEIAFNTIRNCYRGIVLNRADGIRIHDNTIIGRGLCDGISLGESSYCIVWRNTVHGWQYGLMLYAHRFSRLMDDGRLMGTSFNKIGFDPEGHKIGNDFSGNTIGIAYHKAVPETRLSHNDLAANDTSGCLVPVEGAPSE